jgi:hypothetical protein
MMKPVRIQLRRTRGWRMPPETVKVDRTTRWGNIYVVEKVGMTWLGDLDEAGRQIMAGPWRCIEKGAPPHVTGAWYFPTKREAAQKAVDLFRARLARDAVLQAAILEELRWKNVACWCALDMPCHGDVLLEISTRRIKP